MTTSLEERVEQLVEQLVGIVLAAPLAEIIAFTERRRDRERAAKAKPEKVYPGDLPPETPVLDRLARKIKRRRPKRAAKTSSQPTRPSARARGARSHGEGDVRSASPSPGREKLRKAAVDAAAPVAQPPARKSAPPAAARVARAPKVPPAPRAVGSTAAPSMERPPETHRAPRVEGAAAVTHEAKPRKKRGSVADLPGTHAFVVLGFDGELVADTDDPSAATKAMQRPDACSKYRRADGALLQGPKKAYDRAEDKSDSAARRRAFADESMLDNEGVEELAELADA